MKKPGGIKQRSSSHLADYHCTLVLLLLTLLFLGRALFTRGAVVLGSPVLVDLTHQFYPWRLFGFSMLKEGVIPLWNPYLFCGQPFVAAMQSAIFYPLNLVFLMLPVHAAINWSFALHLFLSGAFVYAYMRYVVGSRIASLVSAVSFMLSAPFVLRIFSGHLSIVCSLPWFPLELLAVEAGVRRREHRYFLLAGAAFAVQFLAGQPQYVFYSLLACLLYLALRCAAAARDDGVGKTLLFACSAAAVIVVVSAGLGAVQLFPGLEFIPHSARSTMNFEEVAGGSFPPENFATFLVPDIFGDFLTTPYRGRCFLWETSAYIGILPLCLALLALAYRRSRHVCIYAVLAAASLLVALGSYTPLLKALYSHVPPFRLFRGSGKALFVAAYSLCFLAGFGCRVLSGGGEPDAGASRRCLLAVITVAALAFGLFAAAAFVPGVREALRGCLPARGSLPTDTASRAGELFSAQTRGIHRTLAFLALSIALFAWGLRKRGGRSLIGFLALGLVTVDLWSFGARYIITNPVGVCWWPRDLVQFIKARGPFDRYLRDIRVTIPGVNQGMNDRLYAYQGYDPYNLDRYSKFINYFRVRSEDVPWFMARRDLTKIASLANLRYLIVPARTRVENPDYRAGFSGDYVKVYENTRVLPRARVVHGAVIVENPERALETMRGDGFDPASMVVLEEEPGISLDEAGGSSPAEIESYGTRGITIRCRIDRPGLLVLSDVYYPGWSVTDNGRPARIQRANYLFRAVPIQAGEHRIVFSYRPASFRWGAWVSVASLILAAAFLTLPAFRRRGDTPRR